MIGKLDGIIPEGTMKNKIRCWYWNNFGENDFKIYFQEGLWKILHKNGLSFKFFENPYPYFRDVRYYFRHYKLKKGDNVVDGGAYPGDFAMYAAKIVYPGKVISFEPDPENYKKTLKNIKLNNIKNIIAIKKALYNKGCAVNFSNTQGGDASISETGKIKVETIRLDEELKKLKIKKIDFIKMDIEGAELKSIIGCKETLKNNPKCELAIASYHIVNGEPTTIRLERSLKEMGFETITIGPEHPTTFGFNHDGVGK